MGLRRTALVTIVNGRARCVVGVAGGCVEAWPGELRDIAEQPGRVRLQHPQRAPAASRRSGTPSSVAPGRQPRAGAGGNRHQPVEHQGHLSGWPLSHSEEIGGRIVRGSVSGPRGCPIHTYSVSARHRTTGRAAGGVRGARHVPALRRRPARPASRGPGSASGVQPWPARRSARCASGRGGARNSGDDGSPGGRAARVSRAGPPRSQRCRSFSSASSLRKRAWPPRDRGRPARQRGHAA